MALRFNYFFRCYVRPSWTISAFARNWSGIGGNSLNTLFAHAQKQSMCLTNLDFQDFKHLGLYLDISGLGKIAQARSPRHDLPGKISQKKCARQDLPDMISQASSSRPN